MNRDEAGGIDSSTHIVYISFIWTKTTVLGAPEGVNMPARRVLGIVMKEASISGVIVGK